MRKKVQRTVHDNLCVESRYTVKNGEDKENIPPAKAVKALKKNQEDTERILQDTLRVKNQEDKENIPPAKALKKNQENKKRILQDASKVKNQENQESQKRFY